MHTFEAFSKQLETILAVHFLPHLLDTKPQCNEGIMVG